MKHSSELFVNAPTSVVVDVLSDLATYPAWNDLVASAEPVVGQSHDLGPAWITTLTAKVGPFARSKQLRFVRDTLTTDDQSAETTIRFLRNEVDGRDHAAWTMEVTVSEPAPDRPDETVVLLTLSYDGGLWIPTLGTVLDGAIERATRRLPTYVQGRT